MDKEKVVVVLLLITIILSIVSVIMVVSVDTSSAQPQRQVIRNIGPDQGVGKVGFEIINPNGGTG